MTDNRITVDISKTQNLDHEFNLSNLTKNIEIPLHHVQQRYNWDCGIACFMMILSKEEQENFLKNFKEICLNEGFSTSVWTIDLAFLLKRFGIPFTYYTITLGADPGYSKETYYSKVMEVDEYRVNCRFQMAVEQQLSVEKRSVQLSEILLHLATRNPAIVLVNGRLLHCDDCELLLVRLCHRCRCTFLVCNCFTDTSPYHGHFIVICGYDMDNRKIMYRNPTYENEICSATFENFEAARHSYGTDEDIIFIKKN